MRKIRKIRKKSVFRILGILLSAWILWGAEGLGAKAPEIEVWEKPEAPEIEVWEKPEAPEIEVWEKPEAPEEEVWEEPEAPEPEDTVSPEVEVSWRDEDGNLVTEFYTSAQELIGELVIREEHLDRENTRFMLSAFDASGEKIPCREAEFLNGKNWTELWQACETEEAETFPVELEESEGCYRMCLHLKTEANYLFSGEIVDRAGNRVLTEVLPFGAFCLDRTPPQIRQGRGAEGQPAGDITWSAEQQTFFQKWIHGLTFGYFCKPVMTVKIGAWDPISGIGSITYEWEGDWGEEEGEARTETETADREHGLYEEPEGGKAYAVLTVPESFRGVVRATARDKAGNAMASWSETVGLLAESEDMHKKSSGISVVVLEGQGKKEGFYRGDVKLRFSMEDTFSGIRMAQIQAGNQEEWLHLEEEEEIEMRLVYEMTLKAEENGGNRLPVQAVLTDFAGHTTELSSVPVIHMDAAAPQVSVEWTNMDVRNENYYNADRIAQIAVRERNFDPEDVQVLLTGMETPKLTWSHIPGKNCGGSLDPLDLGHGDDCTWTAQLVFDQDGEYEFGFSCVDAAGNEGSWGKTEKFIIDKTPPVLQVEWNPVTARNGRYFSQERTAVLVITEKHFRPEDAQVEILDLDPAGETSLPAAVRFRSWGEEWRGEAVFGRDGTFCLQADCVDLAGNAAVSYESEVFVVDRTPPEITFFGVADHSANGGTAAPGFRIQDVNCDAAACFQECAGTREEAKKLAFTRVEEPEGLMVRWEDFAWLPENDDFYHITVQAADLAGNETAAELAFSVNRFGSVYVLAEETERLAGPMGTRYTAQSPELVIEEYNVDFLETKRILCSRDGETAYLKEGWDYTVEQSGDSESWKCYRYVISSRNFEKEGVYLIVLYSEDTASNSSSSGRKEPSMEFVVDKTGPDIVIANVEDQGQYQSKSRRVRIDMQDPSGLKRAELEQNGVCMAVWEEADLVENQGQLSYHIPEESRWQTLQIRAWDGAGNVSVTDKLHILVTDSRVFQFREKRGLYAGIAVLLFLCLGAGGCFFVKSRIRKA